MASDTELLARLRSRGRAMEAAAQALWVVAGVLRDREMSHTASTVSDLAEMLSCAVDDDA